MNIYIIFVLSIFLSFPLIARQEPKDKKSYEDGPGFNVPVKVGTLHIVPTLVKENVFSKEFQNKILQHMGKFTMKVTKSVKDSSPKGTIIFQHPKEGSLVEEPGVIKVFVSAGPE